MLFISPICDSFQLKFHSKGSNECRCNEGFSGNGKICEDIDECMVNPSICGVN